MKEIDFRTKSDIESSISRLNELINSNILLENPKLVYKKSVLIEVIVLLRDLLKKSDLYLEQRVSFKEDVNISENIKDVTDLITKFRDSMCHIDTPKRNFTNNESVKNLTITFCELNSKGVLININGIELGNKYDDDIAFIMGNDVLYLKRHIYRVFDELKIIFSKHNSFQYTL